ncbi:MAG TPA: WG repeat-containing protein [Candidatus Coprenecus stercoravium]|uniref:WG repeat-containing protein n=1 Tax=Candidatus Coprenecus stercoravium TaxID=2840735 RepID=A0A9D2K9X0_9BACT|nr:WG repeat-containing protein [Candidatus Coprenecus stercoravium]
MRRICMAALMALGMSLVWSVRVQAQGFTVARDEATGKYGYKANGIWIINPEYDRTEAFSESMAVVRKDGKYGYIDVSGRLVIPVKYQDAGAFSAGLAPVCLYGKYGYVDKSGEMVVPFKYSYAFPFSEGLAAVELNGKVAYIGPDGKTVIPYMLDSGKPFKDGIAEVTVDGQTKYMDKVGNIFDEVSEAFSSFSGFARHMIEEKVNAWQKKGRYEKTADWMTRVNESTRQHMVDSLLGIAQSEYIAFMSKNVGGQQTIVDYDADGEIFLIQDSYFGSLLVPVPIAEAENFETSFSSVCRTPYYAIQNDGLGLREMTYTLPDGRQYRYDNSSDLTFAMADIEYEFDAIDINAVPDNAMADKGSQQITTRQISVGTSDVDKGIPEASEVNDRLFAVIIANEDYQREVDVNFAVNDGNTFGEYCRKTLGIPEQNIHIVENATLNNILAEVDWITKVAEAYQGEAGLIFYYAGHGIPDESTGDAYLLPVDGYGSNINTGYKLDNLYASLSSAPSRYTYVFLDACFSGAERGGSMIASARGIAIRAKSSAPKGNMVVFSAAQGDETAYPYKEKGHGMFTYYLLKKLQESGGDVTLGELSDYVRGEVRKQSIVSNSKMQTPTVMASPAMHDSWQTLQLVRP